MKYNFYDPNTNCLDLDYFFILKHGYNINHVNDIIRQVLHYENGQFKIRINVSILLPLGLDVLFKGAIKEYKLNDARIDFIKFKSILYKVDEGEFGPVLNPI